ncbi:MAG: ABC transporter permease [Candidatus Hodarchaeales archaeon]|jgi:ABC-2 type transport system permease protein
MKFQRVKTLVIKDIKMTVRSPAVLFLALLFPLILTGAFGLAFGSFGSFSGETTYTVGIVDLDGTTWSEYFKSNVSESEVLVETTYTDSLTARNDLEQGKIDAYVILPDNFSESIDSFWLNPVNASTWVNTTVDLYVDQGSMIVSVALPPLIQQIMASTLYGEQSANVPQPVQIGSPSLVAAEHFSQFDYIAPGMFAYAAIFITMIVSQSFTEERQKGILSRIQLTPTSPAEIITGSLIANMITAVVQVAIVFTVAGFMGFKPQGGVTGIAAGFILVTLLALCNVGFGLITATLAKSPESATGISFIFILPQMFLGTFVPVPETIARLVPSYYVTDALTSILLRGAEITSPTILVDFGVIGIFCVAVIAIGIALFTKFGKE